MSSAGRLRALIRREGADRAIRIALRSLQCRLIRASPLHDDVVERGVLGNRMLLDLATPGVSWSLATRGVREEAHTRLMGDLLEPGQHVLDLGANIGYYTLLSARAVGPEGRVLALEPDPGNLDLLERNVELNGFEDRVEILAVAASDRKGTARLAAGDAANLRRIDAAGTVEVETVSLDDLLAGRPRVDLLRMDVEGHEVQVLDGMDGTVEDGEGPRRILMEVHPSRYEPRDALSRRLEHLFDHGYATEAVVSAGTELPSVFADRGLEPVWTMQSGRFLRGCYEAPDEVTAELVARTPKVVRYVLLAHRA